MTSGGPGMALTAANRDGEPLPVAFEMKGYLQSLKSSSGIEDQKSLAEVYDRACESLIGANDVQVEGNRTFKKKSAWRKLGRYFGISTAIRKVEKEVLANGHFLASVVVRAEAPWGQTVEEIGACCTDEEVGRRKITVADAIATASTRATNRAVSSLIAMGEVSAEEIRGQPRQRTEHKAPTDIDPTLLPGNDKAWGGNGGKPIKDVKSSKVLVKARDWMKEKDEAGYQKVIEAIDNELEHRRAAQAQDKTAEGGPAKQTMPAEPEPATIDPPADPGAEEQDEDDELPF